MNASEPKRSNKRTKHEEDIAMAEATVDANDITGQLPTLRRAKLEEVAAAAILSSSVAAQAAAVCLKSHDDCSDDSYHFQHCVRCHKDFDPDTIGPHDCVMEEDDDNIGMIEVGNSGLEYIYPCCHQEDGDGPCWTGSHLVSWEKADVKHIDRGSTHIKYNDGGYWKDQQLVLKWKARPNKSSCFECCENDDDEYYHPCADCCTCGKAGHEES